MEKQTTCLGSIIFPTLTSRGSSRYCSYLFVFPPPSSSFLPNYSITYVFLFFFFFNLLHQCLHHRAVNPSAPLPPIEPWLKAALERPEVISERCRAPLEQIKKNFPLTEVEKKKPLKTSAQIYGKE